MANVAAANTGITTKGNIAIKGKAGELLTVRCAFCKGKGRDPYGQLSRLSDCQNCLGRGAVRITGPVRTCPFCDGSGVHHRNLRLVCLVCGGTGVVRVPERLAICPRCHGRGAPLIPEGREQAGRVDCFPCLTCRGKGVVDAGVARSASGRRKAHTKRHRPRLSRLGRATREGKPVRIVS